MSTQEPASVARDVLRLPPLILHPFAHAGDPAKLMESSRAGLVIEGVLPPTDEPRDDLDRALLDGRYAELTMLFYLGKDLCRWVGQCLEVAAGRTDRFPAGVCRESFVAYLVGTPPAAVVDKLRAWGVHGYHHIFCRAVALNGIFVEAPERSALADEFIRSYYRYLDRVFGFDQDKPFPLLDSRGYDFELYASGEYSRLLEREWEA